MRRQSILLWLGAVAVLALHLWSLRGIPNYFVDEMWFGSRAWSFTETGRAFGPLDQGVFEELDGHWTLFPWLPVVIQAAVLKPFAEPQMLALRLLSLAFGVALVAEIYCIARRLLGRREAILSAFLLAVSFYFIRSAHMARYDIFTAVFGYGALLLYLRNHVDNPNPRLSISYLCGFIGFMAVEIHSFGAIYLPVIGLLYLAQFRLRAFTNRYVWAWLGGVATGIAIYVALHIVPYPDEYFKFYRLAFGPTHTPSILTFDPGVILNSFFNTFLLWSLNSMLHAPVTIIAAIIAWRRRTAGTRILFGITAGVLVMFALLCRTVNGYYAILALPPLLIVTAAGLVQIFTTDWPAMKPVNLRVLRTTTMALTVLWVAYCISLMVTNPTTAEQRLDSTIAQLKPFIRPDDRILATQTYWIGFYDHPYYSPEQLIYYERFHPETDLEDTIRTMQLDILIVDGAIQTFIPPNPEDSGYSPALTFSRTELFQFLDAHAEVVTEFQGMNETTTVYRIDQGP